MKNVLVIIGALITSGVVGCSQPAQAPVSDESSALTGAQSCQSQDQTCIASATSASAIATCQQQLESCLEALVADAGLPPVVAFDAGSLPSPGSLFDGSLPPVVTFDAAGFPFGDDAAIPSLPPILDDAGLSEDAALSAVSAVDSCIQTLQSCLSSSTDPQTCASQVVTCLQQAI
jgi:hypothetical protein